MEQDERREEPRLGSVLLGMGSNLGDRVRNIELALGHLVEHVKLESISTIYESEPEEVKDQPWFLNLVCAGVTRLKQWDLLEYVHEVEKKLGRERGPRYGPRVIDIDILAYDDLVMAEPDLEIPHPRMAERGFVLVPLAEIAPEWRHPVSGMTADEMLADMDAETVRPYSVPPSPSGAPFL